MPNAYTRNSWVKSSLIFHVFSLMLLWTNVTSVFAQAPTTPKILFTSARDGNREVYIMNPDGSEQIRLTQHPENDMSAVWSPTGEQILFVSDRDGARDLYLMDADGSNVRRVFKTEIKGVTYRDYPTWSPDGKQIAYMHINWDKDIYAVYIATLGEQEEEELTFEGFYPVWSPDGTEIVCSLSAGRIGFINVRTGAQKLVLPRKVRGGQMGVSVSGAGDKLAFSWNKNPLPPDFEPGDALPDGWADKQTIYIVKRDGTDLRQLVDEAGPKATSPELSPNGDEVLYTQKINGHLQIFKLDLNSGVRTQLTHIEGPFQANAGGDWFDPAYALPVEPQPQLLTTMWAEVKKE